MFNTVTIIGMGLMGGSLGKALLKYAPDIQVTGVVRRPEAIDEVLQAKAAHSCTMNLEEGVADADLVVLSLPVLSICQFASKIAPYLKKGCVVTDMGSTKKTIVQRVTKALGADAVFIGSHPIAGSEKTGISSASGDLFCDSLCIVTTDNSEQKENGKRVRKFWEVVGCRVSHMDSETHDYLLSAVSHVPHLISAVLMHFSETISCRDLSALDLAGSGFRDTTRLAAGSAGMWADICLTNKSNLMTHLRHVIEQMNSFLHILDSEDKKGLIDYLEHARIMREKL